MKTTQIKSIGLTLMVLAGLTLGAATSAQAGRAGEAIMVMATTAIIRHTGIMIMDTGPSITSPVFITIANITLSLPTTITLQHRLMATRVI